MPVKLIHLADLHFGKCIHGVSMLENDDQPRWVDRLLDRVEALRPDAVLIAGDVYDRSAPSPDAVQLLSRMLTALSDMDVPVMMTSGNHDSTERLAFARPMLARQGLHISRALMEGAELAHVALDVDGMGPVTFWLMPYVFPALVSQALGEGPVRGYDAAIRALIAHQPVDFTQRNVLIAHQNVTCGGAEAARGGSESMVGGVGQVDYTAFDGFDYVALGHIHAAAAVGRDGVRYAGTPMCYHFNETRQAEHGGLVVTLGEKGAPVQVEPFSIEPLHPMRLCRGPLEALRAQFIDDPGRGEYVKLVLTDQPVSASANAFFARLLESRGSVLMELTSEYRRKGAVTRGLSTEVVRERSVDELFADFCAERSDTPPDERDIALMAQAKALMTRADVSLPPSQADIDRLLEALMREEAGA